MCPLFGVNYGKRGVKSIQQINNVYSSTNVKITGIITGKKFYDEPLFGWLRAFMDLLLDLETCTFCSKKVIQ